MNNANNNPTATCERCGAERPLDEIDLHDGWCGECYASHSDGCDCPICTEWNRCDDEDEDCDW